MQIGVPLFSPLPRPWIWDEIGLCASLPPWNWHNGTEGGFEGRTAGIRLGVIVRILGFPTSSQWKIR